MEIFLHSETWVALMTLTFLEVVLGVDNIIFISIVSNKLPQEHQVKARNIGLLFALIFRIALLMGISYIIGFTTPLFTVFGHAISGRDLILLLGGLFLIAKSTTEIHHKLEGMEDHQNQKTKPGLSAVIFQIVVLDIIFSFDSILTAVGLTEEILVMIVAVIIAMIIMMSFAGKISAFINKHPSLQMLALSFLILIGFMLAMESFHYEIPKGYIYFAVFFSLVVEILNIRMSRNLKAVKLRKRIKD